MSAKWFKQEMERDTLLVRVILDFRTPLDSQRDVPAARIDLYTGFVEDEVVWGGAEYRSDFWATIGLRGMIFPVMKSPEDCWREVKAKWAGEVGWLQRKAVVCRGQRADSNVDIRPHHLLVLEHLARAQALLQIRGYEDFGIYAHLARRLNGLIRSLNREWSAATVIPV